MRPALFSCRLRALEAHARVDRPCPVRHGSGSARLPMSLLRGKPVRDRPGGDSRHIAVPRPVRPNADLERRRHPEPHRAFELGRHDPPLDGLLGRERIPHRRKQVRTRLRVEPLIRRDETSRLRPAPGAVRLA